MQEVFFTSAGWPLGELAAVGPTDCRLAVFELAEVVPIDVRCCPPKVSTRRCSAGSILIIGGWARRRQANVARRIFRVRLSPHASGNNRAIVAAEKRGSIRGGDSMSVQFSARHGTMGV
jgi:hypothetical protein